MVINHFNCVVIQKHFLLCMSNPKVVTTFWRTNHDADLRNYRALYLFLDRAQPSYVRHQET